MADTLVTYAQNREDLILHVLLLGVKKGFYVDVGANSPNADSVTKFFYEKGWNGINIEPIPALYAELSRARKRDINLNLGVALKPGKLKLRQYEGEKHGWSTFSKDIMNLHNAGERFKEYDVVVRPLASILKEHNVKDIDFLKVDVEGLEYDVLKSNDWNKFRPKVIVIENTYPERWISVLQEAGYVQAYDDILNLYFVREDLKDICNMHRNYGEALLSGQQVISNSHKEVILELAEVTKKYNILREQWASLHIRPNDFLGVRALTIALLRRIYARLRV